MRGGLVARAAGVLAAQGGDGGGAAGGPVHAGLFEPGTEDGFAAGFDGAIKLHLQLPLL